MKNLISTSVKKEIAIMQNNKATTKKEISVSKVVITYFVVITVIAFILINTL